MELFIDRVSKKNEFKDIFNDVLFYILSLDRKCRKYTNYKTKYKLKSGRFKCSFTFRFSRKSLYLELIKGGKGKRISLSKGYQVIVDFINLCLNEKINSVNNAPVISNTSEHTGENDAYSVIRDEGLLDCYNQIKSFILKRYRKVRYNENALKNITYYISKKKTPKIVFTVLKKGIYVVVVKSSSGYTKKYKLCLNSKNVDKAIQYIDTIYSIDSFAFAKKKQKRNKNYTGGSRSFTYSKRNDLDKKLNELPDDIFDIEG